MRNAPYRTVAVAGLINQVNRVDELSQLIWPLTCKNVAFLYDLSKSEALSCSDAVLLCNCMC